ncbi:SusD/RagB family nutrient-binding outer membrane lipoprotein [Flagellimonas marina]|uniref:SusD/RagB family nutrient-binding outer membrane lipoprotein n=1 Tax=Flagellimonas marina TaxID=1775168 RepID=A0ABV8PJ43_9FLAO
MKNYNKINIIGVLLLMFSIGCETVDLNHLNDPSELTPSSADPELLLNNVQLRFVNAIAYNEDNEDGINVRAAEFVRMQHLFGAYVGPFSMSAGNLDNLWTDLYRESLQDINVLIPLAEERELEGYIGVAKLIQAYIYVTLVDMFGDVPFTEALQGNDTPNPNVDDGESIYNTMFTVIDEGIAAINAPGSVMPNDLFYGGNKAQWIKMANTLKFKMYLQMRLVGDFSSEINSLINQGLITSAIDDFEFKYSATASTTGESRHPYYALNYDADGADDYLVSYYVNLLKDDKGFEDPRLRYYFYRQIAETPTGDDLPCEDNSVVNFCHLGDFYWTRDHGDDDGVPADGLKRSTYGLYPIGGAFDADKFLPVNENPGAGGVGIFPFMLSSYVNFMQAESALMSGTTGNPRTLLEDGIRASMNKVLNFNLGQVDDAFAATTADVDNYVDFVLSEYDAAADDVARLDIIMKEYYIALWGNGIEAYNNYRRTGLPSDFSNHVGTPGAFPRTFLYPATVINTNSNISQKEISVKTFWDANTANLD